MLSAKVEVGNGEDCLCKLAVFPNPLNAEGCFLLRRHGNVAFSFRIQHKAKVEVFDQRVCGGKYDLKATFVSFRHLTVIPGQSEPGEIYVYAPVIEC